MKIEVEKLVYGGDGLARVNGEVILTPFVIAGETAEIEREPKRTGIGRGRLGEVLLTSPDRVAPSCPYFGRCGGCHYQHLSYEAQVAAKRSILIETLARTGKIEAPPIEIVKSEPYGYRNRIQLHFEEGRLGYREARSHKLCAIDRCPISSPKLNESILALNGMMRARRWPSFLRTAELFTNETDVQFHVLETERPIAQKFFHWLKEEIPGLVAGAMEYENYRVSYGSFFQVNRFLVKPLIEAVLGDAQGVAALDLYAGVGLFTLPLATRFGRVKAVESGTGATRDLAFNAAGAGARIEVLEQNVDSFLAQLRETPDFVLADPPRTGLGKAVIRRLIELAPREIVIVACDPSTLARDGQTLLSAGYQVEKLTFIDLFPQTFHIESVARFRRD